MKNRGKAPVYSGVIFITALLLFYGMFQIIKTTISINSVKNYESISSSYSESFYLLREIELKWRNIKLKDKDVVEHFNREYIQHNKKRLEIESSLLNSAEATILTQTLFDLSERYKDNFLSLVNDFVILGLNHESGLYGKLRDEVHILESMLEKCSDLVATNHMLMLRRDEKDFMLRGLNKYLDKFDHEYSLLHQYLSNSNMNDRDKMVEYLERYRETFKNFVDLHNRIGLSENGGIIKENYLLTKEFDKSYNSLILNLNQIYDEYFATLKGWLILTIIALILFMVMLFILRKENGKAKDQNPLTSLPGNRSIQAHINYILRKKTTHILYYFDFNDFKPFNDKYGFKAGDEVIVLFAELLTQNLSCSRYFVGHIGGDDFFASITTEDFEESQRVVQNLQKSFEDAVKTYYSEDDIERGRVVMKSRDGEKREFPLLSVSISGMVIYNQKVITTPSAINILFADLKKSSKESPNYFSVASII